nr:Zn-ribbon domain-containing OB-fold protein [Candidatus Freyrarchaeum guaymaensis]
MSEEEIVRAKSPIPFSAGFRWSVGEVMEHFIKSLGERKILGGKCPRCGYTYVPPRNRCGKCYSEIKPENLTELSGKGVLVGYTIAHVELDGVGNIKDLEEPLVIGAVKLDGADSTIFVPIGEVKPEEVKSGMRVEVAWREETEGEIGDIKYFKPAG